MSQVFAYTESTHPWSYLNLKLSLELLELRQLLQSAATDTLGLFGGALQMDVLALRAGGTEAIVRLPSEHATELWGALALVSGFDKKPLRVTATDAGASLVGLGVSVDI
ncbi:Ribonuclease P protein subunit p14 [Blastocladiella emersonii ATCC 22665]|nr:Ribonuclease P protein subunit p14 [Blastocladiella emersonii ATCC 22665]